MSVEREIPLARPEINEADVAAVRAILTDPNGRLALGPNLTTFEGALARVAVRKHAVAVNSGTSALHLIVRSLGLGPGDEVITTPFSFVASTNCLLMEGATPVFVDIEPTTLCIDPEQIEAAITPRTRAILGVDVFGHPADWPRIEAIAEKHGLTVIEDSAEALGSRLGDQPCGGFGAAGVFAFYPNKQITTGEGGAVVTDDENLAAMCRSMADQGRGDGGWLSHVRLGYNYRLDEMSAALGVSQMTRLDDLIAARARVAQGYLEALSSVDGVILPTVAENVFMSWFVFVIRLAERFSRADRDRILEGLRSQAIGCRNYFQPLHLQPFLREALGTRPGQFPVTEAVSDRTLALPFFSQMTDEQIHRVADVLKREMERIGRE